MQGECIHRSTLWNMDETSAYLDMPPAKTLAMVGAKSVEIATTRLEYTRVAVVLCCNATGTLVDPLVIHKCDKDATNQNEVRRLFIQTANCKDICMYVTKNGSFARSSQHTATYCTCEPDVTRVVKDVCVLLANDGSGSHSLSV